MAEDTKPEAQTISVNEKKWGKAVVDVGWSLVPNILLERQSVLGLDSRDLNILLFILKHWWNPTDLPFPEMKTIAAAVGCSRSTVQRHIRQMEASGFIKRLPRKAKHGGNTSHRYDPSGLIKHLRPYAKEELSRRKKAKAEEKSKLTPAGHKPGLKVAS